MRKVVLAVDGNSLVHRSYHAHARTGMRAEDGRPTWAVRGLLTQLVLAVERVRPDAVVVGFDDPDHNLRREIWPHYKAQRPDKLATLTAQLAFAADVLSAMGVAVVVPPRLEADDVLASAAAYARAVDAEAVLVSSDRDVFALIDERTRVLRIIDGGVAASPLLTPERLVTLLGVRPEQYLDLAALRGDPSDNLPGVRGIGPKTAAALLDALGSAQAAFEDLAAGGDAVVRAIGPARARVLAEPEARERWEANRRVMTMHADVPLELDLDGGGPGCLPLTAEAVRRTFQVQRFPWTPAGALRALCGIEPEPEHDPLDPADELEPADPLDPEAAAGRAVEPRTEREWPDEPRPRRGRAPRYPRLPERPRVDQLALF